MGEMGEAEEQWRSGACALKRGRTSDLTAMAGERGLRNSGVWDPTLYTREKYAANKDKVLGNQVLP